MRSMLLSDIKTLLGYIVSFSALSSHNVAIEADPVLFRGRTLAPRALILFCYVKFKKLSLKHPVVECALSLPVSVPVNATALKQLI